MDTLLLKDVPQLRPFQDFVFYENIDYKKRLSEFKSFHGDDGIVIIMVLQKVFNYILSRHHFSKNNTLLRAIAFHITRDLPMILNHFLWNNIAIHQQIKMCPHDAVIVAR